MANTYLEGTYSEIYPDITQDEAGLKKLFKQFSFPGGIPSHVAPETPGSIHEGRRTGLLAQPCLRRRLRQSRPDRRLRGRRRRGRDRPAGHRLALQQVPQPRHRRRRAADPPPQRLQDQQPDACSPASRPRNWQQFFRGYGWTPLFVEGDDPAAMHQLMAAALDHGHRRDPAHPGASPPSRPTTTRPALADDRAGYAQGLDRPEGGRRPAGRRHLPRRTRFRCWSDAEHPEHVQQLEAWLQELPAGGAVRRHRPPAARTGRTGSPGRPPHGRQSARQRRRCCCATCGCPISAVHAVDVPAPGAVRGRGHPGAGPIPARRGQANNQDQRNFRIFGPDETALQPARRRVRGHQPPVGRRDRARRRVPGRRRTGAGLHAQRAPVPGLAGRLSAHRPARPVQQLRGLHPHRRFDVQPARQVAEGHAGTAVAARRSPRSTTCWPRTSGGRTTTASPTRTPASSTTWSTRRPTSSASTCRRMPTACCR